jgi:hypothetical protein
MPRRRIWKKSEIALLGTAPDAAIAKRLNVSSATVCKLRNELRIPAHRGQLRGWGTTELGMLGRYSDAEIAKITNRPVAEVTAKRTTLRISAFKPARARKASTRKKAKPLGK